MARTVGKRKMNHGTFHFIQHYRAAKFDQAPRVKSFFSVISS